MSCTTVLGFNDDASEIVELQEYGNGWGSAPHVWESVGQLYCGLEKYTSLQHIKRVFGALEREDLPYQFRVALTLTANNVYVVRANYRRLADDLTSWDAIWRGNVGASVAYHWPAIIELLRVEPPVARICFHWTSVDESPLCGEWDEATETHGKPDLSTWHEVYDVVLSQIGGKP